MSITCAWVYLSQGRGGGGGRVGKCREKELTGRDSSSVTEQTSQSYGYYRVTNVKEFCRSERNTSLLDSVYALTCFNVDLPYKASVMKMKLPDFYRKRTRHCN
jgi:hypothetical protein